MDHDPIQTQIDIIMEALASIDHAVRLGCRLDQGVVATYAPETVAAMRKCATEAMTTFDSLAGVGVNEPFPVRIKNPEDNVRDLVLQGPCWLEIGGKSLYILEPVIEVYTLGDEGSDPLSVIDLDTIF